MGETRNESSSFRKARDHPPGRALPLAGATDAANTRHPVLDILPMVCALADRRAGGARRPTVEAGSGLESHPRRGARTHHRDGPGRAGVVAARTRHTLHRCRRLFCLGILGVSIAQGARRGVGDGTEIPVLDDSQDAVTSIFIFHELPPKVRRAAFREFARVLKPGGRLVLVDSLQRGDEPDYDGLLEVFPHFHEPYYASYLEEDFSEIARACNLRQTRTVNVFVSKVMVFDKPAHPISAKIGKARRQ